MATEPKTKYLLKPENQALITSVEKALEKNTRYNSIRQFIELAIEEKLDRETKKPAKQ